MPKKLRPNKIRAKNPQLFRYIIHAVETEMDVKQKILLWWAPAGPFSGFYISVGNFLPASTMPFSPRTCFFSDFLAFCRF